MYMRLFSCKTLCDVSSKCTCTMHINGELLWISSLYNSATSWKSQTNKQTHTHARTHARTHTHTLTSGGSEPASKTVVFPWLKPTLRAGAEPTRNSISPPPQNLNGNSMSVTIQSDCWSNSWEREKRECVWEREVTCGWCWLCFLVYTWTVPKSFCKKIVDQTHE